MRKELGFIGLGKMGKPMVQRLQKRGWRVVTFDKIGGSAQNLKELALKLKQPRVVWLMVPAGKPVDEVLGKLILFLQKGDTVVDGGNSFYKDSLKRGAKLARKGISFLDVGVSGGPVSIEAGKFAIMVGGDKSAYTKVRPLLSDLSDTQAGYMGKSGAGHFAKMVHNGIEYGMMQALAEGFAVLKKSPFKFRLQDVARAYNRNSIITSRLVGWLEEGFRLYGEDLRRASTKVSHTGEGEWTVKTAKQLKVSAPVIEESFRFRVQSAKKPSFTGKILSTLRAVFGGHKI
ncbi:MAG: 6-phosphogluconate dehydrogenase (decarboxylating) [Candidatus Wildermuthbacteria bacterium RIFCSPHIGHO2_01_FULL_48_25]|uniref:6-phosphogluconate dehydrogenase (Decarboxylating) n=1 Tax=Candidatus Wildermuthbacteria bacterium RIFCSPLOWO2_01_FULL_48_16 TaxID=1802461 RepID=A0A1G2RJ56_9BACT|nr:MAG: 6-phosphogluconate dehydrogenase (decarboxylating) [Candidatus Wildermuthbacteria bacterium RIFCSPHIGHO2_01_FULL_48_25]OHA72817.1 MAG: 6-phosphogluconate dehydrogenase (decarboxylating) [Candidatus Wildermuthbacteria bacterium RIFCSPLOWO2_01_FULL_48_16]